MSKPETTLLRSGLRVRQKDGDGAVGTVTDETPDCMLARILGGITCAVRWDGDEEDDIQWTDDLEVIDDA